MRGRRRCRSVQARWVAASLVAMVLFGAAAADAKHGGGGLALPIIGGLAGGGLLTSAIYQQHEISQMQDNGGGGRGATAVVAPEYVYVPAQPVYAATPSYSTDGVGSNYANIQARLQELDSLCAQNLVPPNQCAQRRQQILNGL